MPENAIIPDGAAPDRAAVPETAKEKFERERFSRRQALKKFGMTSAMATFALFSVDDLARMVGKAMEQRAGDNKVAEQIATEFLQAGIALAGGDGTGKNPGPIGSACDTQGDNLPVSQRGPCCTPDAVGYWCSAYPDYTDCDYCVRCVYGPNGYCSGYNLPSGTQVALASNRCPIVALD